MHVNDNTLCKVWLCYDFYRIGSVVTVSETDTET